MSDEIKTPEVEADKNETVNIVALYTAHTALREILTEKFPLEKSMKILKLQDWVEPIIQEFDEEKKVLLDKFGTPVPQKPGMYNLSNENIPLFNSAMEPLTQPSYLVPKKLKFSIGDLDGIQVSPQTLRQLQCFISDFKSKTA